MKRPKPSGSSTRASSELVGQMQCSGPGTLQGTLGCLSPPQRAADGVRCKRSSRGGPLQKSAGRRYQPPLGAGSPCPSPLAPEASARRARGGYEEPTHTARYAAQTTPVSRPPWRLRRVVGRRGGAVRVGSSHGRSHTSSASDMVCVNKTTEEDTRQQRHIFHERRGSSRCECFSFTATRTPLLLKSRRSEIAGLCWAADER